jgi:hypothetical protein
MAVAVGCEVGTEVASNSKQDLRSGPSVTAKRVLDEKASAVSKRPLYYRIYFYQLLTVKSCAGDWMEISDSRNSDEHGWIPATELRRVERTSDGKRIYVERDFDWTWARETARYKREIVAFVNKISRENEKCVEIDVNSLRFIGRSKIPEFFVRCTDSNDLPIKIFFKSADFIIP